MPSLLPAVLVAFLAASPEPAAAPPTVPADAGADCGAAGPPEAAARTVADGFAELTGIHGRAFPGPSRGKSLARAVDAWARAGFDAGAFARDALRAVWDAADEPTRSRWSAALADRLVARYRAALGDPRQSTFEVTGHAGGCDRVRVTARLEHRPSRRRHEVAFDLHPVEGAWRVRDVVVDGSSLVRLWRKRLEAAFASGGLPAVEAELTGTGPRQAR